MPNVTADPCKQQADECASQHCPYGVHRSYGHNGCERCECVDPCRQHRCPDKSQCSVDLTSDPQQGTTFIAVCRSSMFRTYTCYISQETPTNAAFRIRRPHSQQARRMPRQPDRRRCAALWRSHRQLRQRMQQRCRLPRRQQMLRGRLQQHLRHARRTDHRGAGAGAATAGAAGATTPVGGRPVSGRPCGRAGGPTAGRAGRCAGRRSGGNVALLCHRLSVADDHVALRIGHCECDNECTRCGRVDEI